MPDPTSTTGAPGATPQPSRLFNRNFVLLWQGQLVSQLGSQAFTIAMMFWLKRATDSATLMGVVMMVSMLPLVVLAPFGGAAADRLSRKRIIVVCDLVSGVSVLSLAAVMFARPDATDLLIGWLFGVAVVGGIVRAFFSPAISAAIPSLVPAARVSAANSLNSGSTEISTLVGQGIGGVLFRVLGAPVLFLVDGVTYLLSALSESFIRIPDVDRRDAPSRGWRGALRSTRDDLADGLRYVWSHRGLRVLMGASAAANFFAMPFFVLLPFYVEDALGATPDWFGYLLAGFGAGGLAGYALAGTLRARGATRGTLLALSLIGVAACMGALGMAANVWQALVLMLVAGVLHGYFHVGTTTILQLRTPDAIRGRVFGLLHTLVMGLAPFGMALAGMVADALDRDVRLVFVACGAILVLTGMVATVDRNYREYLSFEPRDS